MASQRKIEVAIVGDASGLQRAFGSAQTSASSFGSKVGSGLATLAKGAAIATTAVGTGFVFALKSGIEQMNQQAQASAQTAAALKSTGGAANVSQKQIEGMASALQSQTGIADDSIQSNENLLLTFTNIRNEAGKGNDIFTQATKTVLDMSQALGQDGKSSAIQLGKALNDPIKGITALQRVGVSFTAGQRESIKAMVDSGNTMGAQKVILGELNKEFGGSAAAFGNTFPGQIEKTKRAFENVTQSLAQALLPTLTSVLNFVNTTVIPGFQSLVNWGQQHWPEFKAAAASVFDWFKTNVAPIVQGVYNVVATAFGAIVDWGRQHWPEISAAAQSAFNTVKTVIQTVVSTVQSLWQKFGADILNTAKTAFQGIYNAIGPILNTIKAVIDTFIAILHGDWGKAWDGLKAVVSNALDAAVAIIKGLVTTFAAAMKLLAKAALDALKAGLAALVGIVKSAIEGGVQAVAGLVGAAAAAALKLGKSIVTGVFDGIKALAQLEGKIVLAVVTAISGILSTAYGAAVNIGKKIVSGAVDGLASLASTLKDKVESGVKWALGKLNPFSPVEHGGEIYIGQPIIKGAVNAIVAGTTTLKNAIEGSVKAAVSGVNGGVLSAALAAKLGITTKNPYTVESTSPGNLAYAYAQMTPGLNDDFAALTQIAQEWSKALDAAAKSGGADAYIQAAAGLKQANDALSSLGPLQKMADGSLAPVSQSQDVSAPSFMQGNSAFTGAGFTTYSDPQRQAIADAAAAAVQAMHGSAAQIQQAYAIAGSNPTVMGFQLPGLGWVDLTKGVPAMADGGMVTKPTLALIGENGPERVTPVGRGSGSAPTVVQNFYKVDGLDEHALMAAASWRLRTVV